MEVHESGTKREKVGRIANMLDEDDAAGLTQASPAFREPTAAFSFTSQFMDGQQSEHEVG